MTTSRVSSRMFLLSDSHFWRAARLWRGRSMSSCTWRGGPFSGYLRGERFIRLRWVFSCDSRSGTIERFQKRGGSPPVSRPEVSCECRVSPADSEPKGIGDLAGHHHRRPAASSPQRTQSRKALVTARTRKKSSTAITVPSGLRAERHW